MKKPLISPKSCIYDLDFTEIIQKDIAETLAPIVLVTRRPDNTGLYAHFVGVASSLEGAIQIKVLFLGETATIEVIDRISEEIRPSAVIFCESFYEFISVDSLNELKNRYFFRVGMVFAWDSDVLDERDVHAISNVVDVLYCVSGYYIPCWKSQLPKHVSVRHFPLGINIAQFSSLAVINRDRNNEQAVTFLSVSAYHRRKRHEIAIASVKRLIDEGFNCKLRIHSNLNQGDLAKIKEYAQIELGSRACITHGNITEAQLVTLYQEADIYVSASQGEAFNIGLRQAIASGLICVFADIPGHKDLVNLPYGMFPVCAHQEVPAIYSERADRQFGVQHEARLEDFYEACKQAVVRVKFSNVQDRVNISAQGSAFDIRKLKLKLWKLFAEDKLITIFEKLAEMRRLQSFSSETKSILVVPSLDAGFFSIVNTYLSHKLFWECSALYDYVLPIWSKNAVKHATNKDVSQFSSYCYSHPDNPNLFSDLFAGKPFSILLDNSSKSRFVSAGSSANAWVDPNLTYIHSEKNYSSAIFPEWRKAMNECFCDSVDVPVEALKEIQDIQSAAKSFDLAIAVHIRHPSHAVEQKNSTMAEPSDYYRVLCQLDSYVTSLGGSMCVVLATDQQLVVDQLVDILPSRVLFRKEVERVGIDHSALEDDVKGLERLKEGRQIQHLMAANQSKWSERNAYDVLVDALSMCIGDCLFHVNSNIATVASVVSPTLKMYHIRPGDNMFSLFHREHLKARIPFY